MDEEDNSLDQILSEAIDLPAEARQSFLARRCGDDRKKLEEARSLLESYEKSADFMEQPASLNVVKIQADDNWVGRSIGEYKLIELIGNGGTGRVYWAATMNELSGRSADWYLCTIHGVKRTR